MKRTLQRISLVLLLSVAVTGCGVRFVYNQLDWLIPWYLDDYIELESTQKAQFQKRLQAYLAWHRQEQLPQYAAFLHQVADQAASGLTVDDIGKIEQQTEVFAQALIDRMLTDLIDLLATASDAQIAQLFERLEKDNAAYRKEYIDVSPQQQRKARFKEVIKYAERWTGRLSDDQVAQISEWAEQFELMGPEIEASRLAWQQEFKRILLLRRDRVAYEAAFRDLIRNPKFGRSTELQKKLEHNSQLVLQLYLALDKSLSASQRKHMVEKLHSYADDFLILAQQKNN